MGQRHNRKRTRSRPDRQQRAMSPISETSEDVAFLTDRSPSPSPSQSSERPESRMSSYSDRVDPLAAKRVRVFGGDAGDEHGELCAPMLQVMLDLFDGVDYEDP